MALLALQPHREALHCPMPLQPGCFMAVHRRRSNPAPSPPAGFWHRAVLLSLPLTSAPESKGPRHFCTSSAVSDLQLLAAWPCPGRGFACQTAPLISLPPGLIPLAPAWAPALALQAPDKDV